MKKKHIIILLSTLIIGIVLGGSIVGIYSHNKIKSILEKPTAEKFKQKAIRMLNLEDEQLKQIEPQINKFSVNAYTYASDSREKIYLCYDSLYNAVKPYLNDKQSQKFEKRLNHLKSETGK